MIINVYPIKSTLGSSVIDDETVAFVERIKADISPLTKLVCLDQFYEADYSFILIESGGAEQKFLDILPLIKQPIYIIANGLHNSLAASIEILSYLNDQGYSGKIIHGTEEEILAQIKEIVFAKKLGVIGNPSDWLIASKVSSMKVKQRFNYDIVNIDPSEIEEEFEKSAPPNDKKFSGMSESEINKALRIEVAISKLVDRYGLSGYTIRCFDLLSSTKTTSCLALSLHNSLDVVAACEGDVPVLITMQIIKDTLNLPSFQANPAFINTNANEIDLAHCTIPLSMCESYSLDTHFESNIGIGIKGALALGPVTIVKISADMDKFYLDEGEMLPYEYSKERCRTQIKLKLNHSVSYFLENPLGNHHVIILGHHKDVLLKFLETKGLIRVGV